LRKGGKRKRLICEDRKRKGGRSRPAPIRGREEGKTMAEVLRIPGHREAPQTEERKKEKEKQKGTAAALKGGEELALRPTSFGHSSWILATAL